MAEVETERKLLIKKRGSVKAKLTHFSNYVTTLEAKFKQKCVDGVDIIQFEHRIQGSAKLFSEFDTIQIDLECITENVEELFLEREQFDSSYYEIVAKAKKLFSDINNSNNENSTSNSTPRDGNVNHHDVQNSIKLPTIQLPKFNGQYEDWLEFRDTFISLIHTNSSISNIQKFHYLRASLQASAVQVISSLEFSSHNYTVAWDLLCNRYNNIRLLIHNHVKSLFNLEQLVKESSEKMRKLIDTVTKHLRALNTLGQPTDHWDTLIIFIISSKLDSVTSREWEEFKSNHDIPTLANLTEFLKNRADLIETLESNKPDKRFPKFTESQSKFKGLVTTNDVSYTLSCPVCKNEHRAYNCEIFLKLTATERVNQAKKLKLCLNCLKPGHYNNYCRFRASCRKCKGKHNTLLHIDQQSQDSGDSPRDQVNVSLTTSNINKQILLSTALVQVLDNNNVAHSVRALLDPGSQSCFVTRNLCERFHIPTKNIDFLVTGINNSLSKINEKCNINIRAQHTDFNIQLSCFVLPEITTNLPNVRVQTENLGIPTHIILADPSFYNPAPVDILIGADIFWDLICKGHMSLGTNKPVLQQTKFGWIVSGPLGGVQRSKVQCNLVKDVDIQEQLANFFELEDIPVGSPLSIEENACELNFVNTTKRLETGRFVVMIPLKTSAETLGESFEQAKRRFMSLERKLLRNPQLKDNYTNFLNEYAALGHMSENTNETTGSNISYYMPHHGIVREQSSTTKLRVVFDASALTSNGLSFNDLQMVGPTVQNDMFAIILRFRQHLFVVSADIEKMYRQVLVDEQQRSLQKILWRSNPANPIKEYTLNTVTYGTAAAPFLAIRCLMQLGLDCKSKFPDVSEIIINDFYVDDLLTGGQTIEEVKNNCRQISDILKLGCFSLRKWRSNEPLIIEDVTDSESNSSSFEFSENKGITKTLGLKWCCKSDELMFNLNIDNRTDKITKRSILSCIAKIFDPLGLLSPCTIVAKIILQHLWREKLSWDQSVPLSLNSSWITFVNELYEINNLVIPRYALCPNPRIIELHCFADARPQSQDWNFARHSTVVLGWINTSPHLLKQFVRNRVSTIQELTKLNTWRHVPTKENPADLLSRGKSAKLIGNSDIWWHGPDWLKLEKSHWPNLVVSNVNLPEVICQTHSSVAILNHCFPFTNFSSFIKTKHCMAYILRFKNNSLKSKNERQSGQLTITELNCAFKTLLRLSQINSFPEEYNDLLQGHNVNSKSKTLQLNPFLDSEGLIRVGGRLLNTNYCFDKKYPILISAKHHFTKLIFAYEHIKLLHAGPQLLLSSIKESLWPISGRNLAKVTVHKCLKCHRFRAQCVQPIMGNLPAQRFLTDFPFQATGIDYAGPFLTKDRNGRGCKLVKSYVALFICFATKALHLELVSDLSTESFILSLKRFIARRGKPTHIYSDNGKNFVGAKNSLENLGNFLSSNENKFIEFSSIENITWHFCPVHAPHFGGIWEAGIKSTKFHLKRVMGEAHLTFEEFTTLLVQIESVLNSRPLTPISADPNDLNPLTPAHFLIGRSLTTIPEVNLEKIPENRLSKYQRIEQIKQNFWGRWNKEYVSELQQRTKWKTNKGFLMKDTLVLIKEDNLPPLKWRLGRILEVYPGKDNVARVASIKTSNGVVKRAFSKICPLPLED